MSRLQEYDVVRVLSIGSAKPDPSIGSRSPVIGDSGTIVSVLAPGHYIVEAVKDDGTTNWLSDFEGTDLELIHRPA